MRRRARGVLLVLCLSAGSVTVGDVVHLNDGSKVEGDVKKTDDGYDVVGADGKRTQVPRTSVKRIELKPRVTPDNARRRLDSLRRSTASLADPKLVITRYKDFLKKFAGTPQAAEAQKDMAVWQERVDKRMVKAGDKWVTAEELGALQQESLGSAIHARRLIKQGRLKEAGPILEEALQIDPKNASALYLKGLMLYRQDQLGPAKKALEAVPPLVPDHGPTLNNLAVIHWRQKNQGEALGYYDQAMVAMPGHPLILNNVAEALNALPEKDRDGGAVKKVIRRFNEQDQELQDVMAKRGLYRWGGVWVSGEDLDALQAKEEEIQDKIEDLEDDFARVQGNIRQNELDTADTLRSIRRMQADSYRRDSSNRTVHRPLPRIYYDLQDDLKDLRAERAYHEGEISQLRQEAQRVRQGLPTPRYTGIQRVFDVEGTPLIPPGEGDADDPKGAGAGGDRGGLLDVPPPPEERPAEAGDAGEDERGKPEDEGDAEPGDDADGRDQKAPPSRTKRPAAGERREARKPSVLDPAPPEKAPTE